MEENKKPNIIPLQTTEGDIRDSRECIEVKLLLEESNHITPETFGKIIYKAQRLLEDNNYLILKGTVCRVTIHRELWDLLEPIQWWLKEFFFNNRILVGNFWIHSSGSERSLSIEGSYRQIIIEGDDYNLKCYRTGRVVVHELDEKGRPYEKD